MADLTCTVTAQQAATAKAAFGWLFGDADGRTPGEATTAEIEAWIKDQAITVVKNYRAWQRSTQADIDATADVVDEGWYE